MVRRKHTDESIQIWSRNHEGSSLLYCIFTNIMGACCLINMLFGYYILYNNYKILSNHPKCLRTIIFTLFGELLVYIAFTIFLLIIRILCGIRASVHSIATISLLSTFHQIILYYICFILSIGVLITHKYSINLNNSTFLSYVSLPSSLGNPLQNKLLHYYIIEASLTGIEVIITIPIVISLCWYNLSRLFDKIMGKPVVQFFSTNIPDSYTNFQDYESKMNLPNKPILNIQIIENV
ncbi:hypothetical protein cand_038020 [Cryptosporidium andersoni]|uniref:Transmembrane protein n=1 Tax=Cryptosporidium andersoni TaxID=117008 RepID=A0A1J4MUR5_9CRYT|nr:hypothetical protein cand_038020 [Cryptosporidium andersoni]